MTFTSETTSRRAEVWRHVEGTVVLGPSEIGWFYDFFQVLTPK